MKYSMFNSIVKYEDSFVLYNAMRQNFSFIESNLKIILEQNKESIIDLKSIHPSFYNYLIDNRFVVPKKIDELNEVSEISKKIDYNDNTFLLTINPTMNCNFKCWYCYETHVKNSKTSEKTLQSIFNLIDNVTNKEQIKNLNLSFFGGEPLLYFDKTVIPIIDYAKKKTEEKNTNLSISFTTNGFLINDSFINYFKEKNLGVFFQITLDGYKEQHDEVRYVSKTRGSYDKIIENVKKLIEQDIFYVKVRINYTNDNIKNCYKIIDDFIDIGKNDRLEFDFHRVWQNDKLDNIDVDVEKILNQMKKLEFNVNSHYTPNNLYSSCYADKKNSAVINYNGDIFKCTARDFSTENRGGYLSEKGELIWENNYQERRMDSKHYLTNEKCKKCRILPLCNGGCTQHTLDNYKKKNYCVFHDSDEHFDKIIIAKVKELLSKHTEVNEVL